jgi:hypothetical protein
MTGSSHRESSSREHDSAWLERHPALDAQLAQGLRVESLDGRFDQAVWARIAAEQRAALAVTERGLARARAAQRNSLIAWGAGGFTALGVLIALAPMASPVMSQWLASSSSSSSSIATLAVVGALFGLSQLPQIRSLLRAYL